MEGVWRAGWLVGLLCVACACASRAEAPPSRNTLCREASDVRAPSAADLCLPEYCLTADPATGGRAARALQTTAGARPIVEWIANAVGDKPAGVDAWVAAGVSRDAAGDVRGSFAAYERAVAMRAATDTRGQLRDAVGLLYHYLNTSEFRDATQQAAIAYSLVSRVEQPEDRASAYINIASLLVRIGNLSTTARVLEDARRDISVLSPQYARMRQLDSFVELGRAHPKLQRLALLEAHAFALRDGNLVLESQVRFNLIELAIGTGAFDDASALLHLDPRPPEASPDDRASLAYFVSSLALERGDSRAAVELVERVLPEASRQWIDSLEDVHGRALAREGQPGPAEQALLRAVRAVEAKRDTLHVDTFKSWLLAYQRVPFEDLFLFYVARGRLPDALAIVQRATARSTLDGLLETEPADPSIARSIAALGERDGSMRQLASSLRSSRAMIAPSIADVIARLRGNHVITYFRARSELWAIALTGGGKLTARKIGVAAELADRVATWRRKPESTAAANVLGGLLLPDEIMAPPGSPIYIVAEDPIAELPFAALRRGGALVLDHNPVAYAPSAAVLSFTRRTHAPLRAIVLGDPTGDLPEARKEATEVAGRLNVTARLGPAAERAVVLGAAEATLIHIAAHTESTPAGFALRMSDGLLDAGAVIEHGVTAGALVLLACSSSPITERDELAPLASAFIAAGAHTVVASRWRVEDAVARSFARVFYQEDGVVDPVRAVAAAQRELARTGVKVEQWSTFAVIGGLP